MPDFLRSQKPSMDEWVNRINQKLNYQSAKMEIVQWFGNTGNFVLRLLEENDHDTTILFQSVTGHKVVSLSLSELFWLINETRSTPNIEIEEKLRWKGGVGFQLNGRKRYFDDFRAGNDWVWCIKRGIAGIKRPVFPSQDMLGSGRKSRKGWVQLSRKLGKKLGPVIKQ